MASATCRQHYGMHPNQAPSDSTSSISSPAASALQHAQLPCRLLLLALTHALLPALLLRLRCMASTAERQAAGSVQPAKAAGGSAACFQQAGINDSQAKQCTASARQGGTSSRSSNAAGPHTPSLGSSHAAAPAILDPAPRTLPVALPHAAAAADLDHAAAAAAAAASAHTAAVPPGDSAQQQQQQQQPQPCCKASTTRHGPPQAAGWGCGGQVQ
jgi:hypothetical protein